MLECAAFQLPHRSCVDVDPDEQIYFEERLNHRIIPPRQRRNELIETLVQAGSVLVADVENGAPIRLNHVVLQRLEYRCHEMSEARSDRRRWEFLYKARKVREQVYIDDYITMM